MNVRLSLFILFCIVAPVFGQAPQKALLSDLQDYHKDIASFETVAAQAVRAGIPDCVITVSRLMFYTQQGDVQPMKLLIEEIEKSSEVLLGQKVAPVTEVQLKNILANTRTLVDALEKNPESATRAMIQARKRLQAKSILKDLRLVDGAVDQFAIENNRAADDPVPLEAWKRYIRKDSRLWRTGADCLGNPFGPQIVDKVPAIPRASYEHIKDVVPFDFFEPFPIAAK